MSIQTTTLKDFAERVSSQTEVGKQLKLSQSAVNQAISRGDEIYIVYDESSKKIMKSYKISPFGFLQNK